jgi:4-amino-4-deoxy-L-arabinose transferase
VASAAFKRNGDWYDGFVIYLPTLAVGGLPWLPAWLLLRRNRPFAPAFAAPVDRLLLLWIAVPLGVLLAAPSRLPLYLLPLFAPLALWLARRFEPALHGMTPARVGLAVGACVAALVAVKLGLAALSPADRDGRAAAYEIARLAPGPLGDVVFVDVRARWELRFYLGTEVRQAWARRRPYEPTYRPARTLEELLSEPDAGGPRVFAVHPLSTTEFERALRSTGRCPERLGLAAETIVYRAPTAAAGCTRQAALEPEGIGHGA